MIHILARQNSILSNRLAELRNVNIQQNRARFRENIRFSGEILAYEISKHLSSELVPIQTPLGQHTSHVIHDESIVLATILRAGLAVHDGFLQVFNRAENAFVSAYRKYSNDHEFEIVVEYLAAPSIEGKTLILCDPMLATGKSMYLAYKALLKHGTPKEVWVAAVIASSPGIQFIQEHIPHAHIMVCDADEILNEHAYIVPGLGDAGDLCYGEKW